MPLNRGTPREILRGVGGGTPLLSPEQQNLIPSAVPDSKNDYVKINFKKLDELGSQ